MKVTSQYVRKVTYMEPTLTILTGWERDHTSVVLLNPVFSLNSLKIFTSSMKTLVSFDFTQELKHLLNSS